jgi:hypothetical protein
MAKKLIGVLIIWVVLSLMIAPTIAWAHQTVQIGDYAVEYGWMNEPVIVNQPNAVVINISGPNGDTNVDVSNLQIKAVFGADSKMLALQPLGEDTPGQFVAPMTPTRPGTYTFRLSGTVGKTTFNNDVVPEEVHTPELVEFPASAASSASANGLGTAAWLGIGGIVLGLVGIALGAVAVTRKPTVK